ncbi:hypothetical protein S140_92 [Shewanella sp. phage 1/40]|uniref:hypothetical protein n=1 Tax=Shewanella sp. phage 1/40 TaxID=1458860 RepID=UPI0004F8B763|nr:hypothetical protein S140_92 [Shewanella sp. phage 1/40]AHK11499.1 hypothetical protein S140_92 [Shewanella sp. phage 1/40]
MSSELAPQVGKQSLAAQMKVDVMIYGGARKSCGTSLINFSNSVDISTRQY